MGSSGKQAREHFGWLEDMGSGQVIVNTEDAEVRRIRVLRQCRRENRRPDIRNRVGTRTF